MAQLGVIWADGVWDVTKWNTAIWAQATPIAPELLTAVVINGGAQLQITFTRAVTFGAGGNGGFAATMSGGASTLTYSSGDGSRILIYDWSRSIGDSETGTLDYTQPGNGAEDAVNSNDVVSFSGETVTVGSEARFNDPTLRHKRTDIYHEDRTLQHNRITIEHND